MTARDFLAGLFLFLLGGLTVFAWMNRDKIRIYLKLQQDGTVDAATTFAESAADLYKRLTDKPKPPVKA